MNDAGDLSAADLCRVYAAAGVPVVWTPDALLRYAKLLDAHNARCDDMMRRAKDAHDEGRRMRRQSLALSAVLAVMHVGLLLEAWLNG